MRKQKLKGQVFTPRYLVSSILDVAGYAGENILERHVVDNSAGDGAFLCEIVRRYCNAFLQSSNDLSKLKDELETYVHGIEIDEEAYKNCMTHLEETARTFCLNDIQWDVMNHDAISVNTYDGKMDYVVGNPPYVRVHNLQTIYERVKSFTFSDEGMTDLYLVFFEIGLKMLNSHGVLCYISPSSWLSSIAGKNMRDYLKANRSIIKMVDLGHYQPFEATTYTMISLLTLKQEASQPFIYSVYNEETLKIEDVETLDYDEAFIGDILYLGNKKQLEELRNVKMSHFNNYVSVKNGFATLADDVFIQTSFPFSQFVIPVIKASTGKWYKAFFPYDKKGKPIEREQIFSDSSISDYLHANKEKLLKGKSEEEFNQWYLYGRTQALLDVQKDKIAINTCIKDTKSIKLNIVPKGHGLYSGLYILTKVPFELIRDVIIHEDFINYIAMLKKYKSGGYYTFNSKELENYLNYKLTQYYRINGTQQSTIFTGNLEFL